VTTQADALPADRSDFRTGNPLLSIHELRTHLLKPASFSLSVGECIAIQGPSGGGKTLLLRAIADLDPNEGIVCLDGRDRTAMSGPEWRRLVGYLPAEPGWWADTVGEHFTDWRTAAWIARDLGFPELAWARRQRCLAASTVSLMRVIGFVSIASRLRRLLKAAALKDCLGATSAVVGSGRSGPAEW